MQCCQAKPLPGCASPSLAKPFLECLGKANLLVVSESRAQNILVHYPGTMGAVGPSGLGPGPQGCSQHSFFSGI